jgi:hypothetical protein
MTQATLSNRPQHLLIIKNTLIFDWSAGKHYLSTGTDVSPKKLPAAQYKTAAVRMRLQHTISPSGLKKLNAPWQRQ